MPKVLDFFREREPRFKDVGDEKLSEFIATKHPEFLKDEEFARSVYEYRNPPSLNPLRMNAQSAMAPPQFAPPVYQQNMTPPQGNAADFFNNEKLAANADRTAMRDAALADERLQESLDYHPLYQASKTLGRAGKVTLAAGADLASVLKGEPGVENLRSFANRPDEPMPVEAGLEELKITGDGFWSGAGALGAKTSAALLRTAPALGTGAGLAGLGAAPWAANALAFGMSQEKGGFDPVGAMIAAGLPGVTKAGEAGTAALLEKLPTTGVVIEVLSKDPLKLKGKVIQKLGGLEISNDVFRKYLEAGGGLLAANAYLTAAAAPQIMALPPEERGEALMDAVAVNMASSLSGFTTRKGTSITLENLTPKLRAEWLKANAPPPKPRAQFPAEEGAPVPPATAPGGYNPFAPTTTRPGATPPPAPIPPVTPAPEVGAVSPPVAVDAPAPPTRVPTPPMALPPPPATPPAAPTPPPPGDMATQMGIPAAVWEGMGNYTDEQQRKFWVASKSDLIKAFTLEGYDAPLLQEFRKLHTPETYTPKTPPKPPETPAPTPPAAKLPEPPQEVNHGHMLANMVGQQLRDGNTVTAAQVRDYAAQMGMEPRQAGEWAELAATEVARDIAQSDMTNAEKFKALVSLHERMPANNERTPTTRVLQQYSTPPALAFVASLLADFKGGQTFVEPTAGHGMLMIGAPAAARKHLNEIDQKRLERMQRAWPKALLTNVNAALLSPVVNFDRVGMNPPFGNQLDAKGNTIDFPINNAATKAKTTKSIDIAIALNTFDKMSNGGKGFAIIGAKTGTAHNGINPDPKARAESYRRPDLIEFFQRFNVVDWFTVSGELYQKMGAAWPVDVIVVHGKGKTPRPENGGLTPPWIKPPRVITSWAELEKLIPNANKITTSGAPAGTAGAGGGGKLPEPIPGSGGKPGSTQTPTPGTQPKPPQVGSPPSGTGGGLGTPGKSGGAGGGRGSGGAGPKQLPGTRPPVGGSGPRTPQPGAPGVGGEGAGHPPASPPPVLNPKLADLYGKLRGKLGGDTPKAMAGPGNRFDPEALSLAGQVASVYVEQGVRKFEDFARAVLTDAPDLWAGLKPYLHGAWSTASAMHAGTPGEIIEDISRANALQIINELENQPEPPAPIPPPLAPPIPPGAKEVNLALLAPYRPVSKNVNPMVMVPRNIADNILTALLELEREVGMPVDDYVSGQLGLSVPELYKALSAPQIDVMALMLRNFGRKSALINSAQTGVGKGRTVAGAIRYAKRHGLIPVLVTATKQLYTDMASRDLVALGEKDFKPYITDNKHYYVDGKGKEHNVTRTAAEFREQMEAIAKTGQLPEGAHGIFTTYFQLTKDKPQGFKEDGKAKAKRKRDKDLLPDGPMWTALRRLAPRLLLVLDEAHLAAGETADVGTRIASLIPNAAGVYYSSATFAKRPDNMNLYAMGTLMNRSGLDYAAMTELLKMGGVPLQQALTSMLAGDGEFIRQELDWSGTPIEFKQTSADPAREVELADDYTSFLRDMSQLAKQINKTTAALVDDVNGERADDSQVDVSDIRFSSRLFNLSSQYLLALRSAAVVREAVAELRAGRKPFITVYNTMEGPMMDLQARKLPLSFNGLLLREMQKMLKITIRDPLHKDGKREVILTPEQLVDGGEFFRRIEQQVLAYDFKGMPISPLDAIKKGIQDAGFTIGELSGRKGTVDESGDEPVITKREDLERQKVLNAYNNGQLDALIGNATTGFSAHSAPEFKDKRTRCQITAQAAPDINAQMQIFGRSFRFGQLSIPKYIILSTALAAERRFSVMLRGKMSGLNANTSADTESGWTGQKGFSADVFNSVGDDVVYNVMNADPELAHLAEITIPEDGPDDGYARYATGKFVFLPNADADRLWNRIMEQYEDTIRVLDETGENPLKATAEDLRARTLEQSILVEGKGNTSFDGPAMMERAEVSPPQKPMSHAEVKAKAAEHRVGLREKLAVWMEGSRKAEAERLAAATAREATPEQLARIKENFQDVRDKLMVAFRTIGSTYGVDPLETKQVAFYGVPMELRLKGEELSDFASASKQQLIVGTNTYKRRFTIPLSKFTESMLQEVDEYAAAELFDTNAETNAERYIITGNLLSGFEVSQGMTMGQEMGKPRVAIYTTHDGSTKTGILMPPRWTPTTGGDTGAGGKFTPLESAVDFTTAVRNGQIIRSLPGTVPQVKLADGILSLPANAEGRQIWGRPGFSDLFVMPPRQTGGKFVGQVKTEGDYLTYLWDAMRYHAQLGVVTPGGGTTQAMRSGKERTSSSRGLHAKGFEVKPGNIPAPVQLGGMQHVRAMEMPELVRLAREMLGGSITVKKPRGKAVAFFRAMGRQGMIQMDPALFKNSIEAAQVMAHEIGHGYDWFDDKTGTPRGNLWGHLRGLNLYLRQKFGRSNVTSKELKAELIKLTEYWRPWDRSKSPKSFTEYRESPEELYADAMSVLFNSPGLLEQMAPKFYQAFWEAINARPQVRDMILDIQELLSKGKYATATSRHEKLTEGFALGEQKWKQMVEDRAAARKSWARGWERLAQEFYWKHYPLEKIANRVEKSGRPIPPEIDPRKTLDDLGYRDTTVMAWGRHVFEKVIQPLEAAGLTLDDLGAYLFYSRITGGDTTEIYDMLKTAEGRKWLEDHNFGGDRATLANPEGFDQKAAQLGLLKMNLDLGLKQMTLLRDYARVFQDDVYKLTEQAVEVGAYNRTTHETVVKPNRHNYATFAVIKHLAEYLSPGLKKQFGTLDTIANPVHATILKSISLINLIAMQTAKNSMVEFLNRFEPGALIPAKTAHEPPPLPGFGTFMRLENGRPTWYYTDPYIADAFKQINPRQLWPLVKAANEIFRKLIYPLIITYNPSFLMVMSPLRDVQRTARNLPTGSARYAGRQLGRISLAAGPMLLGGMAGATLGPLGGIVGGFAGAALGTKLLRRGSRQAGEVANRYEGQSGPLIREMEANLGLGTPFDQLARMNRDDFMADLFKKMRVMPDHEMRGWYQSHVFAPVRALLDGLELGGLTLDTVAKTSAYQHLRSRGYSPKEAAHWVRNNAGLPNINKKGLELQLVRPLVPFWNVAMQGWRADLKNMSHPTTRSGWWLRYMATNGMLRALLALAATGALGVALKELFGAISEYNKTNYASIPVGTAESQEFGSKTAYLRVPEDETARFLGGIISKGIRSMGPDDLRLSQVFDFGMGQLPSINPAVTVPVKWTQYVAGQNPTDPLRGGTIIPENEFNPKKWDNLVPMAKWTLNQSGAPNFIQWDPQSGSTWQMGLSAIPGINKFIQVSDQGYREAQRAKDSEIDAAKKQEKLKLPPTVKSVEMEYWKLERIDKTLRTPQQVARLEELEVWYKRDYRPAWESLQRAIEDKTPVVADSIRKDMERAAADYYRKR